MSFNKYVLEWFHEFVEQHESDNEWCEELFSKMGYDNTFLDKNETPFDYLMSLPNGSEIYEALFGYSAKVDFVDDLPDTLGFLTSMFQEVAKEQIKQYDFAKELIEDMTENCTNYSSPIGFFEDLQYGGCKSGMIGMFIYHDSCKKFYINHIDDMETFLEDFEEEVGTIKRDKGLPYYTWLCWFCYEELAYQIARTLWETHF